MSDLDNGTDDIQPADDIRSLLTGAIAETADADAGAAATDAAENPSARARGADGKFATADSDALASPENKDAPVQVETAGDDAAAISQTATVEPPTNWSEADKATFKTLPEAAQGFVLKRYKDMEADYTRKTQAVAALRTEYEPVEAMFAPHRQALTQAGLSPGKIIQAWGQVERDLTEGRGMNVIKGIVDQPAYKIDKQALAQMLGLTVAQAPAGEQPGTAVQPNGTVIDLPPALRQQLDELSQWKTSQVQQQTAAASQAHTAAINDADARINAFTAETDANGAPAYPHFTALQQQMAVLATAARAAGQPTPSLKELYETAAWANPSTRTDMLAAQQSAATKKAQDEARAKAAAARKAGSSVTGAPATGQSPRQQSGELSLQDALRQAVQDASA